MDTDAPFIPSGEYSESQKSSLFAIPREQISVYTSSPVGLTVANNGEFVNVAEMKAAAFLDDDLTDDSVDESQMVILSVQNPEVGVYEAHLPPSVTSKRGNVKIRWEYTFAENEFVRETFYKIVAPMPTYDSFSPGEKSVVRTVAELFGDLFDNTNGGAPSFVEEFQTNYNYERIAQLMVYALSKVNTIKQPLTNFVIGPSPKKKRFPEKWFGLLQLATYVEVLKHFIRTYVEQPTINGGTGVSYVDRRDYMTRWQQVLQGEQKDLEDAIRQFKREALGFGQGSFLVSGGIYGRGGSRAGSSYGLQARGARFYPLQSMVVMV